MVEAEEEAGSKCSRTQHCSQQETVEHVLIHCRTYNNERCHLILSLKKVKHH